MADAKASEPGTVQAARYNSGLVLHRPAAMGRQLRSPVRFRLRLPAVVRSAAVRQFRHVRQAEEGGPHLGVPRRRRSALRLPGAALLFHSGVRLQVVRLPELPAVDGGFLRFAEYQLQEGGAGGMTNGVVVGDGGGGGRRRTEGRRLPFR